MIKKRKYFIVLILIVCILIMFGMGILMFLSDNTVSEQEDNHTDIMPTEQNVPEPIMVVDYLDHLEERLLEQWQERLMEDGELSKDRKVYSYYPGGSNNLDANGSLGAYGEKELEFYFYTLDEFCFPTFYKSKVRCTTTNNGIQVWETDNIKSSDISNAETAKEWEICTFVYNYIRWNESDEEMNLASMITGRVREGEGFVNSGDGREFEDLTSPETALPLVMSFSGGNAESVPDDSAYSVITTYTFADGSKVSYRMTCNYASLSSSGLSNLWFPVGAVSENEAEQAALSMQYINRVTADDLRRIDEEFSVLKTEQWEKLPDEYSPDNFVKLSESKEDNIALYGLYGGSAMALLDGDTVYPVYIGWVSPQMNIPIIYKSDYDSDGIPEYALYTHMGTGTGVSLSQLYMLELPDDEGERELTINQFTLKDMRYQMQYISYDYSEDTGILAVNTGSDAAELEIKDFLENYDMKFEDLVWGDIIDLEEKNGQWCLVAQSGIRTEGNASPDYECGFEFRVPVTYMENGYFQLEKISVKPVFR